MAGVRSKKFQGRTLEFFAAYLRPGMKALATRLRPLGLGEILLAQTDRLRRDLEVLVI